MARSYKQQEEVAKRTGRNSRIMKSRRDTGNIRPICSGEI